MMRITIQFNDGTNEVHLSEYPPKFSENFICIAPQQNKNDVFYNIMNIRKIVVEPDCNTCERPTKEKCEECADKNFDGG